MRVSYLLLILGLTYLFFSVSQNLLTERNDVSITISDPEVLGNSKSSSLTKSVSLLIAVVGDVHLPEGPERLIAFKALLLEVKAAEPDLIVFVGDYTANPREVANMPQHRENIINAFKLVDPIPRAIVLGNYESWSDEATLFPKRTSWLAEFARLGVDALENETRIIATDNGSICVRGFGDKYTNRFEYIDYPEKCRNLPKVSIMHDPAGAFEVGVKGFVIAGHTHCGQVSFPFIGPLWVPSDAPSSAHCGLYEDSERTVFVTSGVGTSILPLRYGAQSQWDMIQLDIIK